jgi:prepilin-type N-terminal cleavage/methylation domain-containing protein
MKGFTLLELLVVLAIVGALSAIAVPQYAEYKAQAYDFQALADLRSVSIAEEAYFIGSESYLPCEQDECESLPGIARLSKGVTLEVQATTTGFVGTASHTRGSGKRFVWNSTEGGLVAE